jgi:HAD superfamily hydrolase (TIGR01509 family)
LPPLRESEKHPASNRRPTRFFNGTTEFMNTRIAQELARRPCWVFDMDGTLTIAVHDFDEIRRQLALPEGQPILEAIAERPEDQAENLRRRLFDLEHELAHRSSPQPGARALLEHLRDTGRRFGIVTRNSEELAHITLAACGLDDLFDPRFVVGRERCAPKPDPAGIRILMELWQVESGDVVMVGDYLFDLLAGRDAGALTVHFNARGDTGWPEHSDVSIGDFKRLVMHL